MWPLACAATSFSGSPAGSSSSSLKAVLQEPAVCDGLPTQQAIEHSCFEARELTGTTPASQTTISIVARTVRAIDV
jgi:hypothetical protein